MNDHSELVTIISGALIPFIFLFALYMMINGHISPGGGFQGGAVFASIFICKYLTNPVRRFSASQDTSLPRIKKVEKLVLLLILLFALSFLATFLHFSLPWFTPYYLLLMNLLIGAKVACGMTLLFFRFIFFEVEG